MKDQIPQKHDVPQDYRDEESQRVSGGLEGVFEYGEGNRPEHATR